MHCLLRPFTCPSFLRLAGDLRQPLTSTRRGAAKRAHIAGALLAVGLLASACGSGVGGTDVDLASLFPAEEAEIETVGDEVRVRLLTVDFEPGTASQGMKLGRAIVAEDVDG